MKLTNIGYYLLFATSITAVNIAITRYMHQQQLAAIMMHINKPRIQVFDADSLVEKLTREDYRPEDILAHFDNINKAISTENILLLDSKMAIAAAPSYKAELSDPVKLKAFLAERNISASTGDDFKKISDEARKRTEILFAEEP